MMASNSKDHEVTFKILVLGDCNVGKTCLIHRFCDRAFYESYVSTIGIDCKQKVIPMDEQQIRLRIWDTAGQERFRTLTTAYYRGAQGIVLVYDITNQDTFNHLSYWLKNIEDMASKNIMKVLVGNKSDKDSHRAVERSQAQKLADNFGVPFIETSCKTGENVDEAFTILAKRIKQVLSDKYGSQKLTPERQHSWNSDLTKKESWCAC